MIHKKQKDHPPKLEVLDSLPQSSGRNFTSQFDAAAKSERLAVAQGLRHAVMLGRLPDVMLHSSRHSERKLELAKTRSARQANVPGLLPESLRARRQIPDRVH